jgi:hypothetical protein
VALNHTNTGADQRKSWARTPALTRTTRGPLKSEYSVHLPVEMARSQPLRACISPFATIR